MLLFPIGTDRPQRRFPWMSVLIIAANVIIYFLSHPLSTPAHPDPAVISVTTGLFTAFDKYLLYPTHPQLYQFITYQFLHQNLQHIFFNMLFLYVFGNNLNEKLGNAGYLAFYLTGGVFAGCGQMLSSSAPTLGASGAISAVSGLYLVLLPRTHIRIFVSFFFIFMDVWEIPSLFFILFKIGGDIFEQVMNTSRVAYMAHLSGTVAGILIGILLLGARLVQRDHYDALALITRWRRRKTYEAVVAGGYNPFSTASAGGGGGENAGITAFARRAASTPPKPVDPRIESLRAEISRLCRAHEIKDAAQRYLELRAIDPAQFLPEQEQLDVANQLMSIGEYPEAAAAYEDYLRVYNTSTQHAQIQLILALIYTRYYPHPDRARQLLTETLPRLHNPQQRDLAQSELEKLGPAL